ncbi:hypothetical protein OQA88_12427 [Cercophora sp. LCS_1]
MHEIFLTAVVPDTALPTARAVLSGLTEMHEHHSYTRVRHLHRGDLSPKSLDKLKELSRERNPHAVRWAEFHQILLKQNYVVQERIDTTAKVNGGVGSEDKRVLRWNDFPDPQSSRIPAFITQRRVLEISEGRVERVLQECRFGTKSESVEEAYQWWLNGVEYALTKIYGISAQQQQQGAANPAGLEPLVPFWVLYVRVQTDSTPEQMGQAHAQLSRVRERLLRVFDFKVFDRRAHDTRIMEQRP